MSSESIQSHSSDTNSALMLQRAPLFPKASTLIMSVVLVVVAIMYYQIYFHYWFVQLMGGRIMRLGFLVLPLSFLALNYSLMQRRRIRRDPVTAINSIIVVYLIVNVVSIIANEGNLTDARVYSFYTAYPVLLYLSFVGIYRTADQVKATMRIILFSAIILTVYAIYAHLSYDTERVLAYYLSNEIEMLGEIPIELTYGGSFVGTDGIRIHRLTLLGLSSPNFASLLVLPIIIGMYFHKTTSGVGKWLYLTATTFLFASLVMTFSRGALISLLCGIVYLIWKRLFEGKDVLAFIVMAIILLGSSGYGTIYGIAKHHAIRLASIDPVDGWQGSDEPRVRDLYHSLGLWKECPLIGCGTTRLIESQREELNSGDHNYYTRKLATTGLLGLIPFVIFITWLFMGVSVREADLDQSMRWLSNSLGAGMVAVGVNLHMLVPAEPYHMWIWFALTAAWIRICLQQKRKESVIPANRT